MAATELDFYLLLVANLTRHMQSKALRPVQAGYRYLMRCERRIKGGNNLSVGVKTVPRGYVS